jgi:hypothetical protein
MNSQQESQAMAKQAITTAYRLGREGKKSLAGYRVELMIENSDGSLRPGMTAYARIEFGR